MNPSYWRSDRRCRMPLSSSLQGARPRDTHVLFVLIMNNACFCLLSFLHSCVCDYFPRSKEVDWQPYFTTRLVDDFATHLRVFRKAQDRLADREDKQSKQMHSYTALSFIIKLWWFLCGPQNKAVMSEQGT